jgi:hypothetical protein
VTQRMRAEARHVCRKRNPSHHLGPGPRRQRLGMITP